MQPIMDRPKYLCVDQTRPTRITCRSTSNTRSSNSRVIRIKAEWLCLFVWNADSRGAKHHRDHLSVRVNGNERAYPIFLSFRNVDPRRNRKVHCSPRRFATEMECVNRCACGLQSWPRSSLSREFQLSNYRLIFYKLLHGPAWLNISGRTFQSLFPSCLLTSLSKLLSLSLSFVFSSFFFGSPPWALFSVASALDVARS